MKKNIWKKMVYRIKGLRLNNATKLALIAAGAVVLAAFIQPAVADWLGRKPAELLRLVPPETIEKLHAISRTSEYPIDLAADGSHNSLEAYYREANRDFFEHYEKLPAPTQPGQIADLVYLMGPAGSGKSTMVTWLQQKTDACKIKLKDEFKDGQLSSYSEEREDLKVGSILFNKMPGLKGRGEFSLLDVLSLSPKKRACCQSGVCNQTVILDDLDELHPELSKYMLRIIERDLQSGADSSLPKRVLVVGRPEGFSYYLKEKSRIPYPSGHLSIESVVLPKYEKKGDLQTLWNALYDANKPAKNLDGFIDQVTAEGWLSYTVSNLAYAKSLKEYSELGKKGGGMELKDVLFDNILEYNFQGNNRPQTNNDVYVRLLEEIAAKFAETAATNDGYFDVPFGETIQVYSEDKAENKLGTLPIREVLNRSGLVFLDPAGFETARYRFKPEWLHAYLADRWNTRISKKQ